MTDSPIKRRPFGERDEEERQLPFGARPPRTYSSPAPDPLPIPTLDSDDALLRADRIEFATPVERLSRPTAVDLELAEIVIERVRPAHHHEPHAKLAVPRAGYGSLLNMAGLAVIVMGLVGGALFGVNKLREDASAQSSAHPIEAAVVNTAEPTATQEAAILPDARKRIGIQSGHRGINPELGIPDPGAVCADGLTEQKTVEVISFLVKQLLEREGYTVDVLDKWDARLPGYSALAMVAIHADSCDYINDEATGFKVASYEESQHPEQDAQLVNCLVHHYEESTGMTLHPGTTIDMTDYYAFSRISPDVPSAIIEVGFLYLDRDFLTEHPDRSAEGIAQGIECFLNSEVVPTVEPYEP